MTMHLNVRVAELAVWFQFQIETETRMHSSRMRTGRSLILCCSLLPGRGEGGVCLVWGGVCLVLGGVLPGLGGLPGPGGVCLVGGGLPGPGRSLPGLGEGGVCLVPGGFSLPGGVLPARGGCPETPSVNRITHTCKNITLATTSLRSVKIQCLQSINRLEKTQTRWLFPQTSLVC